MPRTLTRTRTPLRGNNDNAAASVDDTDTAAGNTDSPAPVQRSARRERLRSRAAQDTESHDDVAASPRSARRVERPKASGWAGHERIKAKTSSFPSDFKVTDEAKLVKFLDGEPFESYPQHWIDDAPSRKSFACLEGIDQDCPLCEYGDTPSVRTCFNIVDFEDPNQPEVRVLTTGPQLTAQIKSFATDTRGSYAPINRDDLYWRISKSGGGRRGKVQYALVPVHARDLEEYWDMVPLTKEELDFFETKMYTAEEVVRYDSRSYLEELIDSLDS